MPPVIPTARSRFSWLPSVAALAAAWLGGLWAHRAIRNGRRGPGRAGGVLRLGR